MLFDNQQMSQRTGSAYSMSSVPGSSCSMMEGQLQAKTIEANEIQSLIISALRLNDWEAEYYCQAKFRIVPFRIANNVIGSVFECSFQYVPTSKLKNFDLKLRAFWKKALTAETVETIQDSVAFMDGPETVFESLKNEFMVGGSNSSTANSAFIIQLISESVNLDLKIWRLVLQCTMKDWPTQHKSRITLELNLVGGKDVRERKSTHLLYLHENVPSDKVKSVNEQWDKMVWKKFKAISVFDHVQAIVFNFSTPSEVYENLINISKFTRKKCEIATGVGDDFNLFGGKVTGKCLRLIKDSIIVHKWRFADWPEGYFATVRFEIHPLLRSHDKSPATKLLFVLEHAPTSAQVNTLKWWDKFWKKFIT